MEDRHCERCGVKQQYHEGSNHLFMEPRPLQVGDILDSQWGYDQTNVDFYVVLKRTKATVTVQKIGSAIDRSVEVHFTVEPVVPNVEHKRGEPFRRKVHNYRGAESISISSYASASRWLGQAIMETAAGFGH